MFDFTNIVKDQTNYEMRINEKSYTSFEISNKLRNQKMLTKIFDEYKQ